MAATSMSGMGADSQGSEGLQRNAIGLIEVLFQSITHMAPAVATVALLQWPLAFRALAWGITSEGVMQVVFHHVGDAMALAEAEIGVDGDRRRHVQLVPVEADPEVGQSPDARFSTFGWLATSFIPAFQLEDGMISGERQQGLIVSAHEFAHLLGIPHPWEMDPPVEDQPWNLMGYQAHGLLMDTRIDARVKEAMGW